MILYPAIDLKDGQCVRLLKGDMGKSTVFSDDPAAQALAFQAAGCEWLHMVDLNGASAKELEVLLGLCERVAGLRESIHRGVAAPQHQPAIRIARRLAQTLHRCGAR